MPTNLEYIEANVNFDDSTYSGKYILLPRKIGNIRKRYNTTYNNTRNSSESDFSHARLNKRRRYSSNKRIARTATNMRVHNKNNNNTKSGKKKDKITNNNIECTVRKYSTRKSASMLPPKVQDPFTDIEISIEPSTSSYLTKYSSSFDWKINLETKFSSSTQKKCRSRKILKLKYTNHKTIKTQYFAQIQNRIN